jgi:NAD(P)-dependent dehydrogenase (short-subunit alcohol dehydrogenase family)
MTAERRDLEGRVALVTGATAGIGRVTAQVLAQRGATVLAAGRNPAKIEATVAAIRQAAGHAQVHGLRADLSQQAEVRALAEQVAQRWPRLHLLVNNAGAVFAQRAETADGLEQTWALNHLAYFLLTALLLPGLRAAGEPGRSARVVNVASRAHRYVRGLHWDDLGFRRGYFGFRAYAQSKLANLLFTFELARRLASAGEPITANTLHPGNVSTSMGSNNRAALWRLAYVFINLLGVSPERGAETVIHLAAAPEVEGVSGRYFVQRRAVVPTRAARDDEAARRLWAVSAQMAHLKE